MRRTAPVMLRSTRTDAEKRWTVEAEFDGRWFWRGRVTTSGGELEQARITVGPWIDLPSEPTDEKLRELRDESVASFLSDPLAPWERA